MSLLLCAVTTLASVSIVVTSPREQALRVLDKWTRAFTDSDVDAIVSLYAPDALFIGTGSKAVVSKPEDIRKYFEAALLTNRPRSATLNTYEVMPLSDDAFVITGLDTITQVKDGNPVSAEGRVTFVVARRGADWQIVHFHRSAMPQ
ncbi:MAG TPA: SgcJ/EcaC family oxidoreductase [Bradyrhizobium sp.]|nr:SgcJ/EcaC family oxidoreductase [Bradyrhizobium sp.]